MKAKVIIFNVLLTLRLFNIDFLKNLETQFDNKREFDYIREHYVTNTTNDGEKNLFNCLISFFLKKILMIL